VRTGVGCISTAFLVDQIAPTVKQLMGESIAATLALPLLWAAIEPSENYEYALLPKKLQKRISRAFANIAEAPGLNPVVREGIFVTGDGSQLILVIMDSSEGSGQENNAVVTRSGGNVVSGKVSRREFAALHAQIAAIRRHTTDEVQQLRRDIQRELQKLQTIVRRVVMQPAFVETPLHTILLQKLHLPGSVQLDFQNDLRICTNYGMNNKLAVET